MDKKSFSKNVYRKADYLLSGIKCKLLTKQNVPQQDIYNISVDSRNVNSRALFVALSGSTTDGHEYIADVVKAGCRVVIVEDGWIPEREDYYKDICVLSVSDTHEVYGRLAAAFYDHPAKNMKIIGITGTNGKTSVTYILEDVLKSQSLSVGVIGTVSYRYADSNNNLVDTPATLTTPEPLVLQKLLYQMSREGVEYVLMEVSSHALYQQRIVGIQFDVGVFTNLSHDHLDYHQDMEKYFQAKMLLFRNYLKQEGQAVVCRGVRRHNDIWAPRLTELCQQAGIPYFDCGDESAFVQLVNHTCHVDKTLLDIEVSGKRFSFNSLLVGSFNVENLLTALTVGLAIGIDVRLLCQEIGGIRGIPGRLQRIMGCTDDSSNPIVFVDYAHTPDALEKVLMTLSELSHEKIITVFGCGGDRDQEKRPIMGGIAAQYSDVVVLTDDNPRSELPEKIIDQIRSGVEKKCLKIRDLQWLQEGPTLEKGFLVVPQRKRAIRMALTGCKPNDIVLIAGKGHEKYQLSGHKKRFFDDCLEARNCLCSWTIKRVLAAVNGNFADYEENRLGSVSTDSRTVNPGDIFVALKGDNLNGHDYVHQAIANGCGCVIASETVKQNELEDVPQIIVEDTLKALGDLAAYRRQMIQTVSEPIVVGITGSCGKTTVKEMVASILKNKWPDGNEVPEGRVLKTIGNFNNLVGLPLSLLPISLKEKTAVLEMGMNRPGEIRRLTEISDPDIACVTNVHPAHLLGLHSIEGVAQAKEELFAGCRDDTVLLSIWMIRIFFSFPRSIRRKKYFTQQSKKM